jgi:F420 biosynthesis protein FbiB-like protein
MAHQMIEDRPVSAPIPAHDLLAAFAGLVRSRRSIRRYRQQPVEPALLTELLELATWAPSAHNRQPWRFCVVTTAAGREALAAAMGAQWRSDLTADGAAPDVIERRVAVSHARLTGAPVLVIPCATMEEMDLYPDSVRSQAEWQMAVQSVALACQTFLLAAHAAGLASCWMCAPLFVPHLVRSVLALPEAWEPQAILTLGYAAEAKSRERVPVASRLLWR